MKKETPLNLLTDLLEGQSTLRLVNVLVCRSLGGKYVWVDLTGGSSLMGMTTENFIVWHTTFKVDSSKVNKYKRVW
jgi:hypothetical protein